MRDRGKRRANELKFGAWDDLAHGGRRYHCTVAGRSGWTARYVKEVDASEQTLIYYFRECSHGATIFPHPVEIIGSFGLRAKPALGFYQEIFDEKGMLFEIHEKYPVDKGHRKVPGGGR